MTIKRLEKLLDLAQGMNIDPHSNIEYWTAITEWLRDIEKLINAEIERQYNNTDKLPCEWCDGDILVQEQTFNLAGREINRTLDYHYCPMCGRELRTPLSLAEGKMR